jgi:hypothetical protein
VRHHAKASSARSIAGQGAVLGSIHRGAFAGCAFSLGADGSGAPSRRRTTLLALALTALALLALAPSALALYRGPTSSFDSFATGNPQALTVDQSNGDVYAIDTTGTSDALHRYDSSGTPKNFTAGPDAGTNTLTGLSFDEPSAAQVAIDNSGGPSDGDIYVAEFGGVAIFSNSGEPIGLLNGSGNFYGNFGEACGVAVDQANGDLYIGDFGSSVWRYRPSGGTLAEADFSGGITTSESSCAVAADQGKVYAASWSEGPVSRYAASDFVSGQPPAVSGTQVDAKATALAIDPSTGELYVDEGNLIAVFDSAGVPQYTFGSAVEFGTDSAGVAVKGEGGKAYVADRTNGEIDVYELIPRGPTSSFDSFATGNPQALTVDQSNGDVYAIDTTGTSDALHRYDSSGTPKNFTAGPDAGTNTLTGLSFDEPSAAQVAIDNSGGPSDGDIYVAEFGGVAIFSNSGEPIGLLNGSGNFYGNFGEACGVAVDQANGDLYIGDFGSSVWRYRPSGGTLAEADFSGGITTSESSCAVAADQGKVYAASWSEGPVSRYAASDFVSGQPPAVSGTQVDAKATALAIDPSTGELYVDEGNLIAVFDSAGVPQYTFGSAVEFGTDSAGVAVKGEGGKAYVADRTNGEIDVYGPAAIAPAPAVTTQAATGVALSAATLHATVNPRGGLVSDCHFEYIDDAGFEANGFTGAQSAPCDPAPGSGAAAVPVSADLSGLLSGTSYHFRVVATNSAGTTAGDPLTFATTPVAFTDPASDTSHQTNATLNGHFDPHGDTITNCEFEWGTTTAYGNTADCAEGDSFAEPEEVSAFINNLTPGTLIHFRLHLTTAANGEAFGVDRGFTPTLKVVHDLTATIGSPGSGAGQFSVNIQNSPGGVTYGAYGVAVDQSSGDVYVADSGNHRIVKLDADGNFISTWGWGVSDGSSAYQVCTSSCQAGISGQNPGQFAAPRYVAVDNSGGPSEGDVYVMDNSGPSSGSITKLDPSGSLVTAWGTGGQVIFPELQGATVDSSGRLNFASGQNSYIRRLDGTTGNFVGSPLDGVDGVGAIAIESSGTFLELSLAVQRFDPSLPSNEFVNNLYVSKRASTLKAAISDLARDPATGDLYVAAGAWHDPTGAPSQVRVYHFDPAGNVFQPDGSTCAPNKSDGFGDEGCNPTQAFGVGELTDANGIGINGATRKTYITDSGQLKIFSTGTVTPPTVTPQDASALAGSSATLNAKVDPEGVEVTDCHFSYVDKAEFGVNGYANATEVPCDPDPGSGSGDVAVSADISGLDPATLYHFRIQAENATPRGAAIGADQTFISRGPRISNTHANPVTATDATLDATINPQGSPTTYHFNYGPTAAYGSSTQESAAIGGDTDHAVGQQITGLTPATTYHFRVVAKNQFATLAGPDVTFTTAAATDSCPNAALRAGHGFSLPDCRAYEQASPIDKHAANALTSSHFARAAANGSAVIFSTTAGLPTTGGASRPYPSLARRGVDGWATNGIVPQLGVGGNARLGGMDLNLATSVSTNDGTGDFYIGDTAAGSWTPTFSSPASNFEVDVAAFSEDSAHFLMSSSAVLAPGALSGVSKKNLYDYDHGSITLAGRVPAFPATSCDDDGGPACIATANGAVPGSDQLAPGNPGPPMSPRFNTISADGSRIVFTEVDTGRLYLREDGTKTTQVSASQATSPDPNGHKPANWMASSRDGATIYFTSCEKLTDDSTAVSTAENKCGGLDQGSDLYSYDVDSGDLTDLTVDSNPADPKGADVKGVVAATDDGSYVYFAANGSLTPGAPAGNCIPNAQQSGACALYLIHNGGAPVDVATISGASLTPDGTGGGGIITALAAKVVDNGTLLLASNRQLTSYDNTGAVCNQSTGGPGPCTELYRYRPGDAEVTCISCSPFNASPRGDAEITPRDTAAGVAEAVPTPELTRNISADGNRVFFETPDALVPADTNANGGCPRRSFKGVEVGNSWSCSDVYEWEAEGTGSCQAAAENGGCLYLLSSGTSTDRSYFVDASVSGDDVFIRTTDKLVPQDRDELYDVYDARVGGGFAYQHVTSPPPCGSAEQCHGAGTPTPPITGAGSAAFSGPGNPAVNRKAKKHRKKKRHHKARHHKRSQKRANANPGGSK